MKIKYYILPVLFALPLGILSGCSTEVDPAETYKGETPEHIFQKGEAALKDKSYTEATKRYEALEVQYPSESYAKTAELHIIYTYYMAEDYASAEAAAERYVHAHPMGPYTDYALYMSGLSNYYQNLGVFEKLFTIDLATRDTAQLKKAFNNFSTVVNDYPNSRYAPAAHQYMVYLRNLLANHELQAADYYYSRGAYVAAANRANEVVQHYQGADAIPKALVMMVKSYRALQLERPQMQAYQVLSYNFPNSSYLVDAMKSD